MIASLGGLGAALCWTVSTLCSSRSTRRSDPLVVAWMMLIGLVITASLALAAGSPDRTPASAWAWRRSRRGRPPVGRGPRHRDRLGAVLAVAALSLLGAYLVFGERLGRLQLGGVAVVIVAVAVLSGFARDVYL